MKKISRLLPILLSLFVVLLQSCANIIPPGGGPRDTLPPVLVNAVPKDSAINFKEKKITLNFDEYINIDNLQDNLVVSPYPETTPVVEGKLKVVTIKLKDSLEANTTYSLNFGRAIKDVNEGNAQPNFTYVFSTGSTIDENTLSGRVILAETGSIDTTLIVVLHNNLSDTAIVKNRPRYYARLDGKGNFQFRFLPKGVFNAFVLPNDYGKKYDDSTKMFAFLNSPVKIADSTAAPLTFYAYQESKEKQKKSASAARPDKSKKEDEKKLNHVRVGTNLENGQLDLLGNLELSFNAKIRSFDTSKIVLNDTSFKPISNVQFRWDTSFTKITVLHPWAEGTPFILVVAKDAVSDSSGNTLAKIDTLSFVTKKEADYGSLKLRFNDVELAKHPVLQMVQNEKITETFILNSKEVSRSLYKPGEYQMRILYDDNRNGIWDPGNYALKKQPELVIALYRKLNIKANFENDVEVNLSDKEPEKKKPPVRSSKP